MKTVASIRCHELFCAILTVALSSAPGCSNNSHHTANDAPGAASASSGAAHPAPPAGDPAAGSRTEAPAPSAGHAPGGGGAARGPHRAVYSLIDNRLAGHLYRGGGLVVVGGSASFAKYTRFRRSVREWSLAADVDGRRAGVMTGKEARLVIPLDAAPASGKAVLRGRFHSARATEVTVAINDDDREIAVELAAGWSTVTVPVPDGLLRRGENRLVFATRSSRQPVAVAWLQIGGDPLDEESLAWYDSRQASLVLPDGDGVTYYVMAPQRGQLAGDVIDPGCSVTVTATADDGSAITGALTGKAAVVDLGELAGKPIRLQLTGAGCPRARLAAARLVVPGEEPSVERGPPPEYVVLWIMDSLRADRVRAFAPGARAETPNFDRLAATGAVFLQHYVQGNESRVSHASLWSSLYPVKHGMIRSKAKLAARWTTIDEVMKAAGKFTSGVSGNGYVAKKWGFGTAWKKYRNHIHEGGGLRGQDIFDRAVESIPGTGEPWFLYLGTIDTHVTWRPKEPWISRYHPERYRGRFAKRFTGHDAGKGAALRMKDDEIRWVRAIYDSNVSYQDELLGQLLAKLDEWGIADKTLIVITADHGDEQWEHERVGHGGSLRETLVHVPLLMHYPAGIPAAAVVEGAEVIDVVPTLADLLGVQPDPEWQGESLLPLAHGVDRGYPRMSMASMYERAHAARMGPWKLYVSGDGEAALYDVTRDPEETTDRAAEHPIALRLVSDPLWLLRTFNAEWNKSQWGNAANVRPALPAHFGE